MCKMENPHDKGSDSCNSKACTSPGRPFTIGRLWRRLFQGTGFPSAPLTPADPLAPPAQQNLPDQGVPTMACAHANAKVNLNVPWLGNREIFRISTSRHPSSRWNLANESAFHEGASVRLLVLAPLSSQPRCMILRSMDTRQ